MQTTRLLLRRWEIADAAALYKYASDPEVGPCAGWPPHTSVEESRDIIQRVFIGESMWAIVLSETDTPIGCIGYLTHLNSNLTIGENDCEVGYWVGKPYWHQGICTEALRLLVHHCVSVKHFEHLWGGCFVENMASWRVMEKCGFRDTHQRQRCPHLLLGGEREVKVMCYSPCGTP